jgi:hypothetical protein
MRIALAYLSVILLWATTPLAIKWSIESAGFLFGVTARMAIGTLCVLLVLLLSKHRLVWYFSFPSSGDCKSIRVGEALASKSGLKPLPHNNKNNGL